MHELFNKTVDTVRPAIAFFSAIATYLMFPEQSFIAWCIALWTAMVLDLLTRWFAIFIKSGGVNESLKSKAWNSEAMFKKTFVKIVAYLVIQILAGLSLRFASIPYISNIVATVVYSFMFFREFASNIENLIDAGADYLQPLLFWVKKRGNEALSKGEEKKDEVSN
ncbi:phage holin family protein [Petroclostridium sp. X23]|uniref:phage holin family protein n=1 Tax=Petroclostridium sp. X23 TaxID=3045146 RepID=UPI0024AD1EA4|nr:phage holin family protein [Petroclostridium sp. X23]WHH58326.1 phage holin family protein [Petroclostridium sp. X23]